jgi:hypothetical protein
MNENFEQDKLIQELRKAAKPVRAPKLSEDALLAASNAPAKTSWRERVAMARRSTRFSLAGAAAVVAISALTLGSLNAGHANIHITLGSSGAQGLSGAADSKVSSDMISPNQSYMPNFPSYNFIADRALSQSEGSGNVYRVDQAMSPSAIMKKLSSYFNVNGKVETNSWNQSGNNEVSSLSLVDGNLSLYVNEPLGQFYYSNADAQGWGPCIREGKANVTVDENLNPNGSTDSSAAPTTYCEEHGAYTQTRLPSDSAAKAQALKIFSDLGLNVDASEISLDRYDDPSFATLTATAALKLDGLPTSFEWTIVWANTGEISSVSGYEVKIVNIGTVSTVSPTAAVDRLADYRWTAWSASNYSFAGLPWNIYKTLGMPAGLSDTSNVATPSVVAQPSDAPTDQPTPQEPTKVDFTVKSSKAVLGTITDSSGQTWILPSYALYGDANNETGILAGIVLAVQDGVIDLPTMPAVMGTVRY